MNLIFLPEVQKHKQFCLCPHYTVWRYLTKRGLKRKGIKAHWKRVKATYRHKRHCLVHELVHYRWKSMPHGLAFEIK